MAAISWSAIVQYIEEAHSFRGQVERADCLDLAFARRAPDEVIDALDALGSRVFPTPAAARAFLLGQKMVTE